jgi:hypothetical protein
MAAAGNTLEQVTAFIDARIVSRPDGPEGPVVLRRTVVLAGRGLTDEVLGLVIARFAQWHGVAGGKVEDDRTRQQLQQQVQQTSPRCVLDVLWMGGGGAFWCCFGRFVVYFVSTAVLCFYCLPRFRIELIFFEKKNNACVKTARSRPAACCLTLR